MSTFGAIGGGGDGGREWPCSWSVWSWGRWSSPGQIYSPLDLDKGRGKPLAFCLLLGEPVGQVGINIESIKRQSGEMMTSWTHIVG
jgi:hypothetical protein